MIHLNIFSPAKTGLLATAIAIGTCSAAFAQFEVGDTLGQSVSEIAGSLEAGGYEIREIDVERNRIEVEAVLEGTKYEIKVDPQSGQVIKVELD
ncbi:PepSY domain-containing protein [Roseibium sp.]|uniref:PepSY domain-containing protein n=1 Tax=Roseibium sp. TaxID=1936156 RepID=UPI003B501603